MSHDRSQQTRGHELAWLLTWCRAFPTLVVTDCYNTIDDSEHRTYLPRIAFQALFGKDQHHGKNNHDDVDRKLDDLVWKEQQAKNELNLTHGEISPETVINVVHDIQSHPCSCSAATHQLFPQPIELCRCQCWWKKHQGGTVFDLGSGNGRVLFAAALAHKFSYVFGLEILPSFHFEALDHLKMWHRAQMGINLDASEGNVNDTDRSNCTNTTTTTTTPLAHDCNDNDKNKNNNDNNNSKNIDSNTQFQFFLDDFTKHSPATFIQTHANIVFVHSTLFNDALMSKVQSICERCSVGTFFVMVSRPLQTDITSETTDTAKKTACYVDKDQFASSGNKNGHENLNLLKNRIVTLRVYNESLMSWGRATVYLQQRV